MNVCAVGGGSSHRGVVRLTVWRFQMRIKDYLISREFIQNYRIDYLVRPILLKSGITTIYADAGEGKTFLTISLVDYMLENGLVSRVFYVFPDEDFTNPILKRLVDKYENFYVLSTSPKFIKDLGKDIEDKEFKDGDLFIIDTLESFCDSVALDQFKDIGKVYAILKKLKRLGCSVLVLNHKNKEGKFLGRGTVKSQSDVFIEVRAVGHYKWSFRIEKHRAMQDLKAPDILVVYEEDSIKIIEDYILPDHLPIVDDIIAILQNGEKKQGDIWQELQNKYTRYKVQLVLRRYDNIYWTSRVIKGRGSPTVYSLKSSNVENQDSDSEEIKKRSKIIREVESLMKEGVISFDSPEFGKLEEYGVLNFADLVAKADDIPLHVLSGFLEDLKSELGIIEEEGLDF